MINLPKCLPFNRQYSRQLKQIILAMITDIPETMVSVIQGNASSESFHLVAPTRENVKTPRRMDARTSEPPKIWSMAFVDQSIRLTICWIQQSVLGPNLILAYPVFLSSKSLAKKLDGFGRASQYKGWKIWLLHILPNRPIRTRGVHVSR